MGIAEDEVEKVAISAAPLQIEASDDLRPVMLQAIKETEQRFRAARELYFRISKENQKLNES